VSSGLTSTPSAPEGAAGGFVFSASGVGVASALGFGVGVAPAGFGVGVACTSGFGVGVVSSTGVAFDPQAARDTIIPNVTNRSHSLFILIVKNLLFKLVKLIELIES